MHIKPMQPTYLNEQQMSDAPRKFHRLSNGLSYNWAARQLESQPSLLRWSSVWWNAELLKISHRILLPGQTVPVNLLQLKYALTQWHSILLWDLGSRIWWGPSMPSVLWRCWLGGRKGIQPVKNWVMGCWHGYLSGARCRFAYCPADATATHYLLLN